jgi:sulfur carrier protein
MQIYINGASHDLETGISLKELIGVLNLEGKRIAIEVNQSLIPRSRFSEQQLCDQDQVEIIHAVGGG